MIDITFYYYIGNYLSVDSIFPIVIQWIWVCSPNFGKSWKWSGNLTPSLWWDFGANFLTLELLRQEILFYWRYSFQLFALEIKVFVVELASRTGNRRRGRSKYDRFFGDLWTGVTGGSGLNEPVNPGFWRFMAWCAFFNVFVLM